MLGVLKWYLTSFHIGLKFQQGKKPYNPLQGEIFSCSWKVVKDTDIFLHYVAEQVSHQPPGKFHSFMTDIPTCFITLKSRKILKVVVPRQSFVPVTALYVECGTKNMCLNGSLSPRCIFTGTSVDVAFTGGLSLILGAHKERYDLTLPTAHARSIISKPWLQLGGKVIISCVSSGLTATITHPKVVFFFFFLCLWQSSVIDTKLLSCSLSLETNLIKLWVKSKTPLAHRSASFKEIGKHISNLHFQM
jgi:hypothetical protein